MRDIFISYSRADRDKAKDIAEALEQQGFSVWWDRDILPGETFDAVIEEALNAANCVIVLWSKTSVSSDWVKAEASEGKRRGILIPVLIDDVKMPLAFRQMQFADLRDWEGTLPHPGFDSLLEAVAEILGRSRVVQPGQEIKADEATKKRREEEERLRREQERLYRKEKKKKAREPVKIPEIFKGPSRTKIFAVIIVLSAVLLGYLVFEALPDNDGPKPTLTPTYTPSTTPSTPTPPTNKDRISGTFYYRGTPVAGIPVALIAGSECDKNNVIQRTNTDDQGYYYFLGVTPGSYYLAINGHYGIDVPVEPYYTTCTWDLEKTEAEELTLDWSLTKSDLQITFPIDEATIDSTSPTFTWNAYPDATRYEIILIQVSPTRETFEWATPRESTSFKPASPLTTGARYELIVWAYADNGAQISFGIVHFYT